MSTKNQPKAQAQQEDPQPLEPSYAWRCQPGLKVSIKILDPLTPAQHRIEISHTTASGLFNALDHIRAEALARGYLIDTWPFDESQRDAIRANLQAQEQQQIAQQYQLPDITDHEATIPNPPAYLAGLYNAAGEPLLELPAGATMPPADKRPCAWCEIHRVWMWQRGRNGRHWFSHPVGEQWCKGKAA